MRSIKYISVLLALILCFCMIPLTVGAANDYNYTAEYDLTSGGKTISAAGTYHITTSASTANRLVVSNVNGNVTLVLDNVSVITTTGATCIEVNSSTVTVVLVGENVLQGCYYNETNSTWGGRGAGIGIDGSSKLTIEGEGSLTAVGGQYQPAIGVRHEGTASTSSYGCTGEIVINSGTIHAKAGFSASGESAAIGGGYCEGAQVTVNGGNITATGVRNGVGIGPGRAAPDGSSVTINGGIIYAESLVNCPGIGGSFGSISNVTINGGVITTKSAQKTLKGVSAIGNTYKGTGTATLKINGGSVYSFRPDGTEDDLMADVEGISRYKLAFPEEVSAPYTVNLNGKALGAFQALNNDGKLTVYASSAEKATAFVNGMIAESDSGTFAANSWKTPSGDLGYIGYQKNANASAEDETYNIRLIGSLKNAQDFSAVGIRVLISGDAEAQLEATFTTIYKSMIETDSKGNTFKAVSAETYQADGLFAVRLNGIPTSGSYTVTVVSFGVTEDSGTEYGVAYVYTLENGVLTQSVPNV